MLHLCLNRFKFKRNVEKGSAEKFNLLAKTSFFKKKRMNETIVNSALITTIFILLLRKKSALLS